MNTHEWAAIRYIWDLQNGWGFKEQCAEEDAYMLGAEMANYGDVGEPPSRTRLW